MEWSVNRSRWRKRSPRSKPYFLLILVFLLVLLILLLSSSSDLFRSLLPSKLDARSRSRAINCGPRTPYGTNLLAGERFLWYAPHSGFSNQLSELKNAILFAAILNRTLIVPPVLDHHAVALGSCPKFRVTSATDLRAAVWDHVMELIRYRRYISMADIIDLSPIAAGMVKTIDFRVFASLWCGIKMENACIGKLYSSNDFSYCRSLLSGLYGNLEKCVYAVKEDCRTTVWTYQQGNDGVLDLFQPDEQLLKKKKFSYVRKRRDIYKAFGPGSETETTPILAFGSLFTSPYRGSELYIDIHEATRDSKIQSLLRKIEFLPFVSEVIVAGNEVARNMIKEPYLCAQLRLLDGQFKNHWKMTFSELKQKLQSLQVENESKKESNLIHIFIMTDLPQGNWTGTYLGELAKNTKSYKLHTLHEHDELVVKTTKKLLRAEHGLHSGFFSRNFVETDESFCGSVSFPDILLYIEETVCSCASMGFVGTAGSTIAESIGLMRKNDICRL
ncbi:hypothetical protein AXF42_Ash012578 [Apostasia shenzhenica]|uniref:Uncharacterized protein n=1 Tax=Apostasia shenzhenica TaxID=1088818 RepID=A0A2H9ZT28_9ASPA|nr:hypothetical protein AXF42_Ash012578 [Apostasia shenzhenica]